MPKNGYVLSARIVLGLALVLFGANGFLQFMPVPPPAEEGARFMTALLATGYVMPLVAAVLLASGALLLLNRFVPLALVLLAPISVNIVAFHIFLDPAGIGPAAIVALLNVGLAVAYRDQFREILAGRSSVGATL